jgi:hypothetical protein
MNECEFYLHERVIIMATARHTDVKENSHTIDCSMEDLVDKINTAIDDIEAGRVISEEEMWKELNKTV